MAYEDFKIKGLLSNGRYLSPSKIWIQYYYRDGAAGTTTVTAYGIGRDDSDPTQLIYPVETLDNTTTPGKETSTMIKIDNNVSCTHVIVRIDNIEQVKVREVGIFYTPRNVIANQYEV